MNSSCYEYYKMDANKGITIFLEMGENDMIKAVYSAV